MAGPILPTTVTPGGTGGGDSSTDDNKCCCFGRTVKSVGAVLFGILLFPIAGIVNGIVDCNKQRQETSKSGAEIRWEGFRAFVLCLPIVGGAFMFASMIKGHYDGGVCAQVAAFFAGLLVLPAIIGVAIIGAEKAESKCEAFSWFLYSIPIIGPGFLTKHYLVDGDSD